MGYNIKQCSYDSATSATLSYNLEIMAPSKLSSFKKRDLIIRNRQDAIVKWNQEMVLARNGS